MDPVKQRAAIAEACGWGGFEGNGEFLIGVPPQNEITEKLLGPKIITNWTPRFDVPDYLNDLNAMHEAEKVLHSQSVISAYVHQLHSIVKANMWAHEDAICATAAQRAEAFLKTIGKWEE